MSSILLCAVTVLVALMSSNAFRLILSRSVGGVMMGQSLVQSKVLGLRSASVQLRAQDLFSDDLFDEDDEEGGTTTAGAAAPVAPRQKYLDQDWELNSEDAKEFDGFPDGSKGAVRSPDNDGPDVPCFAIIYKFRREYQDMSIDSMLADHKGHCNKFRRLINSEVINLGKAKGVVLLWAGLNLDDKTETKADIMTFLEDDPLIIKDVVEKWDLIDLETTGEPSGLPPLKRGGV